MNITAETRKPKVGDRVRVVMEGRVTSVEWEGGANSTLGSVFTINGLSNPVRAWASHVKSVDFLAPEEPLGVGAVVRTRNGRLWVRVDSRGRGAADWVRVNSLNHAVAKYAVLEVVEILNYGVTEES